MAYGLAIETRKLEALFRRAQAAFGLYEYAECLRDIKSSTKQVGT